MTSKIQIETLAGLVAKRIIKEMEDHGSIEDFCEKLVFHPEMYALELAYGAIDCISSGRCLDPKVVYGQRPAHNE